MNDNQIDQSIANIFIELLATHLQFPERPWLCLGTDNSRAYNPIAGKYYCNINPFILSDAMMDNGYLKNEWATCRQIKSMNGKILNGENPTTILRFISSTRTHQVFNLHAQTIGLPEEVYAVNYKAKLSDNEKDKVAEELIKSCGATIFEKLGNDAFYGDRYNVITIPLHEKFHRKADPYHSLCLHELGLWTGGKDYLKRPHRKDGLDFTCKEHFIAELIAAITCAHLGFEKTITINSERIQNWITLLKSNPKSIRSILSNAQKGADFIFKGQKLLEAIR